MGQLLGSSNFPGIAPLYTAIFRESRSYVGGSWEKATRRNPRASLEPARHRVPEGSYLTQGLDQPHLDVQGCGDGLEHGRRVLVADQDSTRERLSPFEEV